MKLLLNLPWLAMLVVLTAAADTLELANGKSMEGRFVSRDKGVVKFETKEGVVVSIDEKDVKSISLGGAKKSTEAAVPAAKPAAKPVAKESAGPITVPAGTVIHVRMKESVNTKQHAAGHKFTAVMETDLVVNGKVVVSKGSNVYGVLQSTKKARRLVGKSEMSMAFTGIMINNQIKPIQAGEIKVVAESGSGKETASRTARAAAIGGLIDGSSGAKNGKEGT